MVPSSTPFARAESAYRLERARLAQARRGGRAAIRRPRRAAARRGRAVARTRTA